MNSYLKKITDILFRKEESPTITYAMNFTLILFATLNISRYLRWLTYATEVQMIVFGAWTFFFASDSYLGYMRSNGRKVSDTTFIFMVAVLALASLAGMHHIIALGHKNVIGGAWALFICINVIMGTRILSYLSNK